MAQIFRPSADTALRLGLLLTALLVIGSLAIGTEFETSSYATRVGWVREQPVPFSHAHHVGGLGIDCRYCHATVENSAHAGLPPTAVCMTCHAQEWTKAPLLAPIRASWASGKPLQWQRVAKLPDYVFFNHSIHVARGVACVSCHGDVSRMPLMARAKPFEMRFCLECHRDPLPQLGPVAAVTNPEPPKWSAAEQHAFAVAQAHEFHLDPKRLVQCDICHR